MHFETDYVMKESKRQKRKRRRATFSTIGVLAPTYILGALVVFLIIALNVN